MDAGFGNVVGGPWLGGAGPEREPVRAHHGLHVPAVAVRLAGVPGVDLLALHASRGLGAVIRFEDLAVEDDVRDALGHRPPQRLGQVRSLLRQHVHGLGDVPVGGRAGDAVVAAQLLDAGPVLEPPQREDRLVTAGQPPAPRRGAPQAPLGGQQPGQVAKQLRRDVEHGTIGDQVESWG
jgi:hypothetical protein